MLHRILDLCRRLATLTPPLPAVSWGKAARPMPVAPLKTLAEGARTFPSLCHHCACGCGLQVTVRDGRIVNLEGDPHHPINEGTLCAKGAAMSELHDLPGRVLAPRIRRAGASEWSEISWDEAIARVAEKFQAARDAGWESTQAEGGADLPVARTHGIAMLGSGKVDNEEAYLFVKAARLLGVTHLTHPAELCHAPTAVGMAATFGRGAMTNGFLDLAHAQWCLILGANPAENHPMAMRWILKARTQGARVLVVDPRFTRTAAAADLVGRIRPGTDLALLGALIRHVLEGGHYDRVWLQSHTNAGCKVHSGFGFADGVFSGFDERRGAYDIGTWSYQSGPDGRPLSAATLEEPDTVFSHLKRHFTRYTPEFAAAVTGLPRTQIEEIARVITTRRPGVVLYSAGLTQHTTGSQTVRGACILQLLLGNLGTLGGGVAACRGEANLQGATDLACTPEFLPGYVPSPVHRDRDLAGYTRRCGTDQRRNLVHLLKAWFGAAATPANDFGFAWLPRRDGNARQGYGPIWHRMNQGGFRMAVVQGQNPLVSAANAGVVRSGLARLETLVVLDPLESETAAFWKSPGARPETIQTEVIHLPTAWSFEKAGSITNAARWVQWRPKAIEPPAQLPSDLQIIDRLFRAVRARYGDCSTPRDIALRHACWDTGDPADPERVLAEINGCRLGDRAPLKSIAELQTLPEDASAGGCWLYAGVLGDGNRAARRDPGTPEQAATRPGWAWSWPDNVRVLYNRAACDAEGRPLDPAHAPVRWNPQTRAWEGPDQIDLPGADVAPDSEAGRAAFRLCPEGVARLFTARYMSPGPGADLPGPRAAGVPIDGPLPEYYEPIESRAQHPLHPPRSQSPLALALARAWGIAPPTDLAKFPILLTTCTIAEHFGSGATRREPWLRELAPGPCLEISPSLGQRLAFRSGDVAKVTSDRGSLEVPVLVTPRLKPVPVAGELLEIVALPWAWGCQGPVPGPAANLLTTNVPDPGAGTPETKACMVNVEKVSRRHLDQAEARS